MNAEIDYLLNHIKSSSFMFIRNGKEHSSQEAYKHILKKYNHFKKKITSTEKFIELSASKSTSSGSPYKIKLQNGKLINSHDYLLNKLNEYRAQQNVSH